MNQRFTYTILPLSIPFADIYTFSAKEHDPETGLSYFGSRYYSSDLSVWLSVDPMSDKYPGLSPYVYCADNPVRCVDPNGEEIGIPPYIKDAIANAITSTAENAHNLYLKASSMVQDHPWMVNAANLMVLAATTAVSKITDMNPKTMSWLEKHLLNFTVTNTSGWESATRLRKDNDGNGQHDGIIPNKRRGDGIKLGGNLQEIWQWTEVY